MTRYLLPAIALAILMITGASQAQEITTEDEIQMQQCIETVHDIQCSGEDVSLSECIGAASRVCMDAPGGMTTVGMTSCTMRENAWWDQYLNFLYQDLKDTRTKEEFALLRDAQRAWITFRDSDCSFTYEVWKEGTIRSNMYASCVLDKTANRAIELAQYVDWSNM